MAQATRPKASPQVSRILKIATDVRRELIGTGSLCDPKNKCTRASTMISSRLARAGIDHEVVGGWFLYGQRSGAYTGGYEVYDEEGTPWVEGEPMHTEIKRPDYETSIPRGHTWIRFPQYDNDILDVTADQFDPSLPGVWFPANPARYDGRMTIPVKAHHPKTPTQLAEKLYYARIYPRPHKPVHVRASLRRHVRQRVVRHLKNPPRACLCHRSRRVDNLRKGLIRRLDR